jgi:hypothetical protein
MDAMHTISRASDQIVDRARAESLEMPGLCLTVPHAARVFGMTTDEAQRVRSDVTDSGFLRGGPQGVSVRRPCPHCS